MLIFRLICLVVCSNQLFQAMVTILSIFTLPCLFSCIVVGQNCNEAIEGWVNGCSIPFGIDFFYKERFKLACNKHDHCYNCVRIPMYIFLLLYRFQTLKLKKINAIKLTSRTIICTCICLPDVSFMCHL